MADLIGPHPRLRVWQIAETYSPDYGGGAAIYVRDVCRSLADRGHEVRVLCTENDDREPYSIRTDFDDSVRVDRLNLPYFKTHDPEGWQLGLATWRAHERRIAQIIESLLCDWRPDIVHYSASRPLGEECLLTIQKSGVPAVGFLHEAWIICPRLMLLRSPTSEPCPGPHPIRCAECMYSHYDGSHARAFAKLPWRLIKLGVYPAYRIWRRAQARRSLRGALGYSRFMVDAHKTKMNGIQHVPLGVNLDGADQMCSSRPRKPLRFGFFAGFQKNKGIWDVLDAAASLKREGLRFEIHVWGPNLETGKSDIAKRGLENLVLLRGMYSADEIWKVYSEIDVALMATTVCEPLGRIPLEAAAAGAPTIAPAIGGITETIRHDVDGLLYGFRDAEDLTRQMRRVLVEPQLLARFAENLPAVPNTRDRVDAVEDFYYQMLGISSAAPALAV